MRRILCTKKLRRENLDTANIAGVEIIEREMIGINIIHSQKIAQQLNNINDSPVVFTSVNAVKGATENITAPSQVNWEVYCIGGATRLAVTHSFPQCIIRGTADYGSALAEIIIHSIKPQPVYFCCGSRRRDELPELLKKNNFQVNEVEVYETILTPSQVNESVDGVMFFSPSAVESYLSANQLPEKAVCYSIGNTTTAALQQKIKNKIITAAETSEESMINTIIKHK